MKRNVGDQPLFPTSFHGRTTTISSVAVDSMNHLWRYISKGYQSTKNTPPCDLGSFRATPSNGYSQDGMDVLLCNSHVFAQFGLGLLYPRPKVIQSPCRYPSVDHSYVQLNQRTKRNASRLLSLAEAIIRPRIHFASYDFTRGASNA
ncbi:hypothetical protein CDEST_02949 [Colletotrichum destructivum]|uniref:Uncharacterized protein n=1 Tax=Colletotrichum destructivum TaxID=34406 RepID=A0AAX4I3M8_9PEZI|nr:hypothetical protein CDEST_02949 [Colletotrichum destructivum]